MTLRDRINEDMKAAMKARESDKLGAIRLLTSALKQKEVDERIEITDTGVRYLSAMRTASIAA